MKKLYGPAKKLFSDVWALGIIENHQARLLTFDEIEEVCERLNVYSELLVENERLRTLAIELAYRAAPLAHPSVLAADLARIEGSTSQEQPRTIPETFAHLRTQWRPTDGE